MASGPPSGAGPHAGAARGPPSGPPYPPTTQSYGGLPAIIPDVPICAVYLFLYLVGAIAHMAIFKMNKKQGHLFIMSAMTFGFCMCRLITFSLRIAWALHPRNVKLGIASNIFVAAGTPLLYVINLIFAHRIIRAQHPRLGWHRALSIMARLTIILILLVLVALITASVQSAFTLSVNVHRIDRNLQLMGTTFYTFIAFLPFPMVLVGLILPRRIRTERFGKGRFRTKIAVLLASTFLLTFRAVWGTTANWLPPTPLTRPAPFYYSKPAFYTVQLLTELLIVFLYAFVRVDLRFYTPTGQRNSYLVLQKPAIPPHANGTNLPNYSFLREPPRPSTSGSLVRVYSEEELFEDCGTLADTLRYSSTSLHLDRKSGLWELKRHSVASLYAPSWYGFEEVSLKGSSSGSGSRGRTRSGTRSSSTAPGSDKTRRESRWVEAL